MIVDARYELPKNVRDSLHSREPSWGFGGLSSAVYYRTYSRNVDGRQEQWADTVIRTVEGVMSIRKDWLVNVMGKKFQRQRYDRIATELADAIFEMKMLPPGRGLWVMGTDYVYERGSHALNNCGAVEVTDSLAESARWMMDSLMCGVGVGFTTHTAILKSKKPHAPVKTFVVPDTKEGWAESVKRLVQSYEKGGRSLRFDYSEIRAADTVISGFGGVSAGSGPLKLLHERLVEYLEGFANGTVSQTRLIADVMNAIGACVVAGNVRRSAELAVGSPYDDEFLNLKNYTRYPERDGKNGGVGWMSNNSVALRNREDFIHLPNLAERIVDNGEPGILNMVNVNKYGRTGERHHDDAVAINPCVTGDTVIATVEGPCTMADLALKGEDIKVYAWHPETKTPVVRMMRNPRLTKTDAPLLEVEFDSGLKVRSTYDHSFYSFRGKKVQAQNLRIGQSIRAWSMSKHRDGHLRVHGWDSVRNRANHQWVGRMVWEDANGTIPDGHVVHHEDHDKENNDIGNLGLLTEYEHQSHHYPARAAAGFDGTAPNHKVVAIREAGTADVFNGTVDDAHTYIILDPEPVAGISSGIVSANCGEIPLESYELCNLVEVFPTRCTPAELGHVLELATFYASTVALLRSHNAETNEVTSRNRRIGVSVSGVADWLDSSSVSHVFDSLNRGYDIVKEANRRLAREAGVAESIRVTTVKPSGTVSLLAGVSSGVHFPLGGYVLRRVRVASDSAVGNLLVESGVPNEPDVMSPGTTVFEFPLQYGQGRTRSVKNVSVYEQAAVVAMLQRCWADNAVSNTLTVQPDELKQVERILALYAPQVKSLSLMPDREGVYPQMPIERLTKDEYTERARAVQPVNWSALSGSDGDTSSVAYCESDVCEVPSE